MKTLITGTIKNVEFIELENLNLQFVYGIVEEDRYGRWNQGDWMVSSVIERIDTEKLLVYTQNSLYQVDQLLPPISLNTDQFSLVRQGIAPSFIKDHS